jgi:hypothetical protein
VRIAHHSSSLLLHSPLSCLALGIMTEAASEDDIDLEILQAQVDASLAQTAALVDSWRSPAFKHTTSGVMTETQFEASLRRPAR